MRTPSPGFAPPAASVTAPLLELADVRAGYDESAALENVSFVGRAGERIAILGPNGGGKTTLFRVLSGELAPWGGAVRRRERIAVVAQTERTRLDFPVSALDVVLMGTISRRPWWSGARRADLQDARGALEAVGLGERAAVAFGALSGGQRQRVLVARALARRARVLLLDEPFTGLDARSAAQLEQLVARLAGDGHLLLIATHDVAQARGWDRILCLNRRQVAFGAPAEVLTAATLGETYGAGVVRLGGDDPGLLVVDDHCGHDDHGGRGGRR